MTAAAVRAAGFHDVTVRELPQIQELDIRYGVAPGHHLQMPYLITARTPR